MKRDWEISIWMKNVTNKKTFQIFAVKRKISQTSNKNVKISHVDNISHDLERISAWYSHFHSSIELIMPAYTHTIKHPIGKAGLGI